MTTTSIGSFGTRRERVELTFDYFGEPIRVNPTFGQFSLLVEHDVDADDPGAGLKALRKMIEQLIHADDVAQFLAIASENGQTFEDLQEIVTAVVETATDRPTLPRSDSSDSRPSTGTSSEGDDFSRARAMAADHVRASATAAFEASPLREHLAESVRSSALRALAGRPDLQVAVIRSDDARRGMTA